MAKSISWAGISWVGAALLLLGVSAASADGLEAEGDAELRATIEAQGQVIEELRSTIAELKQLQETSRDRIMALEDERKLPSVSAGPSSGVTPEWVDRRIEQFQTSDESRFFLSGYASTTYVDAEGEPSTFETQFNPIFQYRLTDDLHFNGELELELDDGGETAVELEFATIDYLAKDWLTVTAGKFLTPFNSFGPRIHPAWINKLASRPVIYDKAGGIIGIPAEVGVMLSGGAPLTMDGDAKFNYAVYLGNGPTIPDPTRPLLGFDNTPDENNNKAAGGRIGFLPIPNLEIGASYMRGKAKGTGGRFDLFGADAWYKISGLELRGELMRLARKNAGPDMNRFGYYLQAAYRLSGMISETTGWKGFLSRLEPVVRWGAIDQRPSRRQLAFGLDYWLFPSVPVKFAYEINDGAVDDDRLFFQLAFGF